MNYATREEWLVALVEALRSMFDGVSLEIPAVRISCSWPSRSIRKRVGECWHSSAAADGARNIFISPVKDDGEEVAGIVVHELVHACLPDGAGHKKPFKDGMKALGLQGKATATEPNDELQHRLHAICEQLGEYPHSALNLTDPSVKKQTTRMIKLVCDECGYIARTTSKWIEVGLPTCVCGAAFSVDKK
jgi:hypothetical protein